MEAKRFLWTGFICHLIAEKALKAVIADKTEEIPPKIHDLPKLAITGGIFSDLSEEQKNLLRKLMPLHIEARYPEYIKNVENKLTKEHCLQIIEEVEEFLSWIKARLGK